MIYNLLLLLPAKIIFLKCNWILFFLLLFSTSPSQLQDVTMDNSCKIFISIKRVGLFTDNSVSHKVISSKFLFPKGPIRNKFIILSNWYFFFSINNFWRLAKFFFLFNLFYLFTFFQRDFIFEIFLICFIAMWFWG